MPRHSLRFDESSEDEEYRSRPSLSRSSKRNRGDSDGMDSFSFRTPRGQNRGGEGRDWYKEVQRTQRASTTKVFSADVPVGGGSSSITPSSAATSSSSGNNNNRVSFGGGLAITPAENNKKPIFSGLLAAPVTPFRYGGGCGSGQIDFDCVATYGSELKADGVSGVFCNSTCGESMSLTVSERKQLAERWVGTGLKVCVHVGAHALPDAIELAKHAQSCGAHAISVMVPPFYHAHSVDDILDYLGEVSRCAPGLPLLLYHFPGMTSRGGSSSFSLHTILKAAVSRGVVPTLRGACFAGEDLADFSACQNLKGNLTDLLFASESNLGGAAFLGATAFVGPHFSVIAPLYSRLVAAASKGDGATTKSLQKLVGRFLSMIRDVVGNSVEKSIAATKALVSLRLQVEMGPPRPPGSKLTVHEVNRLRDEMQSFVEEYVKIAKPSAPAAAPINVKAMPGYNGKLNAKILERIDNIADRIGVRDLRSYFPHLSSSASWRGKMPDGKNAARFIDHTILKPEVTKKEVSKLCQEAMENDFYAVCVNGSRADQCLQELKGSNVCVACVIGFPLGAMSIKGKARESRELSLKGVDEIDMVMNVGMFKDGNYRYVYEDIQAVVEASAPAIVKVIFETCLLTPEEIMDATILSVAARAAFVKTSTGFNKGGATPEAIDIMLATVGNEAEVKASGGVRDGPAAEAYISAGVRRIGTSSGIAIIKGSAGGSGY